MAAPFLCFTFNFVEGFAVLWLKPFLGLAYAELKVNFVEGCAVLCLRRFSGYAVSGFTFEWLRRLRRNKLRLYKA